MPKLKKEKFKLNGDFIPEQTTYKGDIELYSYYDVSKNYFYFDMKEIRLKFPDVRFGGLMLSDEDREKKRYTFDFTKCRTKKDAVVIMKAFVKDYGISETKRMLRIELTFKGEFDADETKFSPHLQRMARWIWKQKKGDQAESGLGLKVSRIMQIKFGDEYAYEDCDINWNLTGRLSTYGDNLIEWDEETEKFVMLVKHELNKMCTKIIDFFNTENLELLKTKMKNTNLLKM